MKISNTINTQDALAVFKVNNLAQDDLFDSVRGTPLTQEEAQAVEGEGLVLGLIGGAIGFAIGALGVSNSNTKDTSGGGSISGGFGMALIGFAIGFNITTPISWF